MSRIHAAIIAVIVAAAVAVGANAAFQATATTEAQVGNALANITMQARADNINRIERRLAKELKDNPAPDRTPVTRIIRVTAPSGSTSRSAGPSRRAVPVRAVVRHDDDDDDDDRGEDRDEREHEGDDD